ncbi:hypothetical protein ACWWJF_22410 [Symbiopectobacterium sp. Eva_TO]
MGIVKQHDSLLFNKALSPDKPEYEGVIKHTAPYFIALLKKKRELYNARRRHSRATQALIKYQMEKAHET